MKSSEIELKQYVYRFLKDNQVLKYVAKEDHPFVVDYVFDNMEPFQDAKTAVTNAVDELRKKGLI